MAHSLFARLAAGALGALVAPAVASATGVSSYLSFADSPFAGGAYSFFHLEDFEDGALDVPGVTASTGSVLGPGALTDSVDGDDGAIDGIGAGSSWYVTDDCISFTFDASVLGALPTHVGFAFTDVGFAFGAHGFGSLSFAAFDGDGNLVHALGPVAVGDGLFGRQTGEDQFFGAVHAGGIARIRIQIDSADWELDHLQFGRALPEPGTLGLLGGALLLLGVRRR